ncbi:hypothetical protein [Bacillus sp. JJ1562]|uniref:hypothetical protein n=1 Tax=Bacillus sp. JJ1562 TaxID=3122960 RepID=UPI0030038D32
MNKIVKIVIGTLLVLNLLLLWNVISGHTKMKNAKELLFLTEVQIKLIELEGSIGTQMENNWSEPNMVTTVLGDVLNGIELSIATAEHLGNLSNDERTIILNGLYGELSQYPIDEKYNFSTLSEEDKQSFEKLRVKLRDAGFGVGIQVSVDKQYFLNQASKLIDNIQSP